MELDVKMPAKLPDGAYTGVITAIREKTIKSKEGETIPYLDIVIRSEGIDLTYGCSQTLTPNSKLGKLVGLFTPLEGSPRIDLDKALLNKEVSFLTMTNENGYSVVAAGSIKPLKGKEA